MNYYFPRVPLSRNGPPPPPPHGQLLRYVALSVWQWCQILLALGAKFAWPLAKGVLDPKPSINVSYLSRFSFLHLPLAGNVISLVGPEAQKIQSMDSLEPQKCI